MKDLIVRGVNVVMLAFVLDELLKWLPVGLFKFGPENRVPVRGGAGTCHALNLGKRGQISVTEKILNTVP